MWTFSENKEWHHLEKKYDWIRRMNDVPQDVRYHAEGNVAVHTQMVLEALDNDSAFKMMPAQDREILWTAALLHDVEKFSTTVIELDGSITSHGHARKGAHFTRRLLYTDGMAPFFIREQISALVKYHGLPIWIFEKPDPLKSLIKVSMEVNTQWLTLLARADMHGRFCADQADMLYRIDCFEAFCQENNCWGAAIKFTSEKAKMYYLQHENAYPNYEPFEQPECEVILMSGLPGAGKDSYIKKHYSDWQVISLDDMRLKKGISTTDKTGNGQIIQEAKEQARIYLRKQQSFVWNATNTTTQMRTQLIDLFMLYKAKVKIVYVEVSYQNLVNQNKNRDAVVPISVLEKLAHKLEVPTLWEAHEVVYHVN